MTVKQAHRAIARQENEPWDWPAPANPGDLSRRLAARRAELRLSITQVAARAGVVRIVPVQITGRRIRSQ